MSFISPKLERRLRRQCMRFAHHPTLGRLASRMAGIGMPALYGKLPLAGLHPKGFFSGSMRLHHTDFVSGKECYVGDGVLIYQEKAGGSITLGDRVHIHENNSLQTGDGGSIEIGSGTHVQPRCQFSGYVGKISIGEDVEIAPNCGFYPYNHSMDPALSIRDQPTYSRTGIEIMDEAWLGYGVVVLDGVRIGKGAVVAAGAVVTKDIPDNAIAAGVPAKVVSTRSEHTKANPAPAA